MPLQLRHLRRAGNLHKHKMAIKTAGAPMPRSRTALLNRRDTEIAAALQTIVATEVLLPIAVRVLYMVYTTRQQQPTLTRLTMTLIDAADVKVAATSANALRLPPGMDNMKALHRLVASAPNGLI